MTLIAAALKNGIKHVLLCFFLTLISFLPAQTRFIDSVKTLLKTDRSDSVQVKHLYRLCWEFRVLSEYDTALSYGYRAVRLAEGIHYKKGLSQSYSNIGIVFFEQGDYPRALEYYLKALKLDEELKNTKGAAIRFVNIGGVYHELKDNKKALDYYLKALAHADESGYKELQSTALGNLGTVYYDLGNNEKALHYLLRAIKTDEEIGNKNGIARALGNIGVIYSAQFNYKHALYYFLKYLEMSSGIGNRNYMASAMGNIGSAYIELKQYRNAHRYLFSSLALADSIGARNVIKETYEKISQLYEHADILLTDSAKAAVLSRVEMRQRALYYHKRFVTLSDTLFSEENKKQLVKKEMLYEFEKKQTAVKAAQEIKDALATSDAKKQKIVLSFISFVLLLAVIAILTIFYSLRVTRRQKELIEKQKNFVEEKQKEILDSIFYARRIQRSLLPTEKYIARTLKRIMPFVICIGALPLFAQQTTVDSFRVLLKNAGDDTSRILRSNDLAWEYKSVGKYDSCLFYAKYAIGLAGSVIENNASEAKVKRAAQMGMAAAYNNLRSVYYNRGNYPQAIDYALQAMKIYEQIGDKKGITSIVGNIGIIYWHQGDHVKSLGYYFKALKLAREIGDKDKEASFLGNIGIVYYDQADYGNSLAFYLSSLELKQKLGDKKGAGNTLGNIGIVYNALSRNEKDPDKKKELGEKARVYYEKALAIAIETDQKNSIAGFLANMGSLLNEQKKYTLSAAYLYRAIAIADSVGLTDQVMRTYKMLSELYEASDIALPDSAKRSAGTLEQTRLKALYYHKRYVAVRDTLFSEENKNELVRKELNYEFAIKEAAAKAEQDKKDILTAAETKKQKTIMIMTSFVLLLLVTVALLVFRSLRITRKQKQLIETQKHLVEEKQKEILDSIYYARRIQRALITSEKYIEKRLMVLKF